MNISERDLATLRELIRECNADVGAAPDDPWHGVMRDARALLERLEGERYLAQKRIRAITWEYAVRLQNDERRLIEAGFAETARAINDAKSKLGWEAARLLDKVEKR